MTDPTQIPDLHKPPTTYLSADDIAYLTHRHTSTALRILRMKHLVERTQLSRATLYTLIATDPTFPKKIQLSARSVGYLESDVDAWIASRAVSHLAA